jgi:hypothetical protein
MAKEEKFYIHRAALVGLLAWPFGLACVSIARMFPRPWETVCKVAGYAIIVGALALMLVGRRVTRRIERRLIQGACPQCGYDLRATLDRCPECGWVSEPEAP